MLPKLSTAAAIFVSFSLLAPSGPAEAFMGVPDKKCTHNYFAQKPCIASIRSWRQFADEQGLDYDRQSAEVFEAYAYYRYDLGDRLLAEALGVDVAEVQGTGRQLAANPGKYR